MCACREFPSLLHTTKAVGKLALHSLRCSHTHTYAVGQQNNQEEASAPTAAYKASAPAKSLQAQREENKECVNGESHRNSQLHTATKAQLCVCVYHCYPLLQGGRIQAVSSSVMKADRPQNRQPSHQPHRQCGGGTPALRNTVIRGDCRCRCTFSTTSTEWTKNTHICAKLLTSARCTVLQPTTHPQGNSAYAASSPLGWVAGERQTPAASCSKTCILNTALHAHRPTHKRDSI